MPPLPRILAGPFVRRVDDDGCAFWIATSEPASATVTLYPGTQLAATAGAATATSAATALRQFGQHLYIGVVQVRLGGDSGNPQLQPGALISYNLTLSGSFGSKTLADEGLLTDQPASADAPRQLALGYAAGRLPSFITPPATIDQIQIAHASCRKSNGNGPDALAWLDDQIEAHYANLDGARLQQLFLTGDQIYADDVGACLLPMLNALGQEIMGFAEFVGVDTQDGGQWSDNIRCTIANFPALRRRKLVRTAAKLSTTDCDNHLFSFGEFAAMYLAGWSPRVWRALATDDQLFVALDGGLAPQLRALQTDWESCYTGGATPQTKWRENRQEGVQQERARVIAWRDAVPKVARALANVATYMIWDDHEVTDDWNLNKHWRNRVLRTELGKEIMRNGSLAYGLFQGWGNDPAAFAKPDTPNKKFLDEANTYLSHSPNDPPPAADTDENSILSRLNQLFGIAGAGADKQVTWSFKVDGPRHRVLALDTRSRRTYVGEGIAPAKLLGDTLKAQVPDGPLTDGRELLFALVPSPVLVPYILEQIAAPIYSMVADFKYGWERLQHQADNPCEPGGAVTGVEDADAEGWGANEPAREELLKQLAGYGKAVILSGDLHYAFSMTLDYWLGSNATPARIVQLCSSAARNGFAALAESVLRHTALLQRYEAGGNPERLAWNSKAPIALPNGATIKPGRRSRMRRSPSLLPSTGWPGGTTIPPDKPPDWRWRVKLVRDTRPENSLPLSAQQPPLGAPELVAASAASHIPAYRAIAARHQVAALTNGFRMLRQMVFSTNVGIVAISGSGAALTLTHTLLSQESAVLLRGAPNTVHTIALAPTSDTAPILQTGS